MNTHEVILEIHAEDLEGGHYNVIADEIPGYNELKDILTAIEETDAPDRYPRIWDAIKNYRRSLQ